MYKKLMAGRFSELNFAVRRVIDAEETHAPGGTIRILKSLCISDMLIESSYIALFPGFSIQNSIVSSSTVVRSSSPSRCPPSRTPMTNLIRAIKTRVFENGAEFSQSYRPNGTIISALSLSLKKNVLLSVLRATKTPSGAAEVL